MARIAMEGTNPDLKKAYEYLSKKQERYNLLFDYYDGEHPLVYTAKRLEQVFRELNVRFSENWCSVIVDSVVDRMQFQGLSVGDDQTASDRLSELLATTELGLDTDDIHLAMLVTGEAFVIAWREEEGIEAYYNDPRYCHVQYDPENPRQIAWAAKWWPAEDETGRLTLYYPDRLEYYTTGTKKLKDISDAGSFQRADPPQADNPHKQVPVFHFRRSRRRTAGEFQNVITLQAAVNKLLSDMMVSAEFAAFTQRYVISATDPGNLRNAPNEIWWIPTGDGQGQAASVGALGATELSNYIEAINNLVSAVSAISRTPHHHFFHKEGAVPSGEALIAMEAPLNKKCERYIARAGRVWQRLGSFLLKLDGRDIQPEAITATYASPATVQPRTQAEIREIRVRAGEPLTYVMRSQGASDAEIEQMVKDRRAERAEAQSSLAQALLEQQRQFDQEEES